MNYKTSFLFLTSVFLITACKPNVSIDGFDSDAWKADKNGCNNQRTALAEVLMTQKEELKKLDDDAIFHLLGTPERNHQHLRGKKNYIYFIQPGSQCSNDTTKSEGKKLIIEFDALGHPRIIRETMFDY
jgi:hypothetical protein